MSRSRNPYRMIRRALERLGWALLALLGIAFIGALIAAAWADGWGAWALTMPLIVVVGIVAVFAAAALIAWPFATLANWWRKKEDTYRQEGRR